MIQIDNLSKVFRIPHERKKTLFHNIISLATRRYEYEEFYALHSVSFRITEGEFIGIIGRNGSGKSTLLKIISKIYEPTSGDIHVLAEVFPLLELGVGFQPDFTVRDNIYLYGSLIGFSRREMKSKLDEVVEFAELTRFVDARLQKLSTGMQVRLGFAIAIQSTAPIMIVDEVLAVGDLVFAEKCRNVFWKFKREGRTIVFVSHDLDSVQQYCDRVIVLDQGRLIDQGEPSKMINIYRQKILQLA